MMELLLACGSGFCALYSIIAAATIGPYTIATVLAPILRLVR